MFDGRRKVVLKWVLGILIGAAVVTAAALFWITYTVKSVQVVYAEGYGYYSEDEIKGFVLNGPLGENSLYLRMKYKDKVVKDVPLVNKMEVDVLAPDSIRITVYEKKIAGYIRFMDAYMYVDRDGYIVENSSKKIVEVPQITGLSFDYAVLGEALPVEDKRVFTKIFDITKLLGKYNLSADKIYVQGTDSITLLFDEVKVSLGSGGDSVEKCIELLPKFLPELEGKRGVLQMDRPNVTDGRYKFTPEE